MFPATDGQLDLAFEHETEFLALVLEVASAAAAGAQREQLIRVWIDKIQSPDLIILFRSRYAG